MVIKRSESRARYYIRKQSKLRGWDINHPSSGGNFLEEQEIVDFIPDIGLGLDRPDFLFFNQGMPVLVLEAKNSANKIDLALQEAIDYANTINKNSNYKIKIAVGAAGEEDSGFIVKTRFLRRDSWIPICSNEYEITTIPSKREIEISLLADDGTTNVQVPSVIEFIDAAIELSNILRLAKVEAPLRPKVIGALVLAMYQGEINTNSGDAVNSVNSLIYDAVNESVDLDDLKKKRLTESLRLLGADYERLSPHISKVVHLLRGLNVRAVLQTDTDFLGLFYEAFLRYGYDNNALGIVFTPRHITKFCAELIDIKPIDKVIDLACGTGGFLVAAFDKMMSGAHGPKAISKVKKSLAGFDTNPTIWALATLNMFFRGDGKSNIENRSCFDHESVEIYKDKYTKAFLNPPFSQTGEPERKFIDFSMNALEPDGLLAVVVKAGIFADEDNANWRKEFIRNHTVLGLISLPEDLFYPTAAPTSILLAKAHIPQNNDESVFMARIWNDGFEKLKGKRIEIEGSQLEYTSCTFKDFLSGKNICANNSVTISAEKILNGDEWSPQKWLPQPIHSHQKLKEYENSVRLSIYKAITSFPELGNLVLNNFTEDWQELDEFPTSESQRVDFFFEVYNGKSVGEKNYREGDIPYISSGDTNNSIVGIVDPQEEEIFINGGITVTAFGQAYVQPWPFVARGNGGSAVRVLIPKFKMSFNELVWFASQINAQKWRIFYARMAIKSRLVSLEIVSPPDRIPDSIPGIDGNVASISDKLLEFKNHLFRLSGVLFEA